MAPGIALGWLNFNDVGSEVPKHAADKRPARVCDIENAHAMQRSRGTDTIRVGNGHRDSILHNKTHRAGRFGYDPVLQVANTFHLHAYDIAHLEPARRLHASSHTATRSRGNDIARLQGPCIFSQS